MKPTPLQRRAERRSRNTSSVDLNLVSLIDVFTILIFFLMSNVGQAEKLPSPKAVTLPESTSLRSPRDALVVAVNGSEITVDGRSVVTVADALRADGDLIAPLKAALDATAVGRAASPAVAGSAPGTPALTIMGDKDIPYQLLRKVMATAARANFTDVSFAVRRKVQA